MLLDHDYALMTSMLCDVADEHCNGRIVSVLEGG
jgi:acetoin utilization deacetylase AcuC-like enzyme